MKTRPGLAALLISVAFLVGGCASKTGTSAPAAADTSGCPTSLTITAADVSKTLCVAVGGTVTVNLTGTGGPWLPIGVSGNVLQPAGTPSTPTRGDQNATYTAKSAGTADITSSHRACPTTPGTVSCHAIIAWKVTVQVK